jgi:hypothetical protein
MVPCRTKAVRCSHHTTPCYTKSTEAAPASCGLQPSTCSTQGAVHKQWLPAMLPYSLTVPPSPTSTPTDTNMTQEMGSAQQPPAAMTANGLIEEYKRVSLSCCHSSKAKQQAACPCSTHSICCTLRHQQLKPCARSQALLSGAASKSGA